MGGISFNTILVLSLVLRIGLIAYSEYYDAHPESNVKYTDIDYWVFTDAARFVAKPSDKDVAQGVLGKFLGIGDPYRRDTYRYTPLLAVLLTPNITLHSSFGKVLFALADIVMAFIMRSIANRIAQSTDRNGEKETIVWRIALLQLLNPMIFSISTRGSSESILGLFVLTMLYYVHRARWNAAAVWFGICVHWKIYPLIYGSSLLVLLGEGRRGWAVKQRLTFAAVSGGTFLGLAVLMYVIWGHPFLEHTYLYHLTRQDAAHNFSPYFYPIGQGWTAVNNPLISFVPQMALSIGTGFALTWRRNSLGFEVRGGWIALCIRPALTPTKRRNDLPFVWFIQTAFFVTFNRVCTSQYFLWYIWFIPLFLPSLDMSVRKGASLVAIWVLAQALWLSIAYRLEFLHEDVAFSLWLASLLFFAVNCGILCLMLASYRFEHTSSRQLRSR